MKEPTYKCPCCDRPFRPSRSKYSEDVSTRQYQAELKQYIQQQEQENLIQQQAERNQRAIDRADYIHLIPFHKRYSSLSSAEEYKYQCLAAFEKTTEEDWARLQQPQSQNPNIDANDKTTTGECIDIPAEYTDTAANTTTSPAIYMNAAQNQLQGDLNNQHPQPAQQTVQSIQQQEPTLALQQHRI